MIREPTTVRPVGIIPIFGPVTQNSIPLVDLTIQKQEASLDPDAAIAKDHLAPFRYHAELDETGGATAAWRRYCYPTTRTGMRESAS